MTVLQTQRRAHPLRCAGRLTTLLVAALTLLCTIAHGQSLAGAEEELTETSLWRRAQDPGSGIRKDSLPPGVKPIQHVPFAGNDSLPSSPPSYPTPQISPDGLWSSSIARAQQYLADWSIAEQVQLVTGAGWQGGLCVGNIAPNKKRGFKGLCLQDSPTGVRFADLVNVFPAGITAAAVFDPRLDFRRGEAMGKEFRAKGVNIALGPGMNHLRSAAAGRNWEMGGADPYLNGESAYNTIRGLQSQGVQACAKHLVGNEQEHFRSSSSSNIDERTLRERRAAQDGTALSWTFDDYAYNKTKEMADERVVDVALVFLQSTSGDEYLTVDGNGGDRNNLTAWHNGNKLVREVASVNSNTIVVIQNPAQVDVEAFIEHENVTAVVFSHMGGREAGNAVVDILYGDYVPSGRLPYTLAKRRSDYSSEVTYLNDSTTSPYVQVNYTEGTRTDYRHFDAYQIEPRFEFGFGLSYSRFEYGQPRGKWLAKAHWEELYTPAHRKGLPSAMFEEVYEFSFTVTNSGAYDGHEVPQAYLSAEGERVKVLRKFERVHLKKGQTKRITWRLNRYDLSRWDAEVGSWVKREGELQLLVGQSSRRIRGTLRM